MPCATVSGMDLALRMCLSEQAACKESRRVTVLLKCLLAQDFCVAGRHCLVVIISCPVVPCGWRSSEGGCQLRC